MKILINVKTTLRSMVSTGVITIAFFIVFPIALAAFMGFLESTTEDGLRLDPVSIVIEDQDDPRMSKELISFLDSEDAKNVIKITEDGDKDTSKLIIPNGYEASLVNKSKTNIVLQCNNSDDETAINVLKVMLDNYHEGAYITLSNQSTDKLYEVSYQKAVETQNIMSNKTDKREMYAVLIFEYVVSMLLYSLVEGSYGKESKNLENRLKSTPVSFNVLFLCDWVSYLVYTFIIMFAYIITFRVTNVAFQGNIFMLIWLILAAAVFITSIATAIYRIFGENIGKVLGIIIFVLPIIGMKMFTGKGNIVAKFAPTGYVIKAFESYFISGSMAEANKYAFIILGVSLAAVVLVFIKGKLIERRRRICA